MRSPEKKERTFLSQMFRTISIYMIIALCSFFTYIMLFSDVSRNLTPPSQNVDASEDSSMNKLVSAIMSANNITADVNISVVGNDLDVNIDVDAKVNMKNFDFDVVLNTVIDEVEYNINLFKNSELDNFLHIDINGNLFKFDLNEISKFEDIDFSSLLSNFSGNEKLSELIDAVGTAIGVDLNDLNMENLMTKLQIVENEVETGHRFTIYFGNLRLTLDATEDFKSMTASVRELVMNNYHINCSVNSITLDKTDFVIDNQPVSDEVDVSSLMDIVENAKYDENSYALSGDIVLKAAGKELSGNVAVKLVNDKDGILSLVRLKLNVEGVDAYVYYINNTVYLNVENLNFKFDLEHLSEVEELLSRYNINFDLETLTAMSVALPNLENFSISVLENGLNLKLNDKIVVDDKLTVGDIDVSLLTKFENENILPDALKLSATLSTGETSEKVSLELNGIAIGASTEHLEDMQFVDGALSSLVTKNGVVEIAGFVDLANILEIYKTAENAENLTFNVDAKVNENVKIGGEIKFDIKDMSFNFDAELDIDGLKLDLLLYGQDVANTKVIYATIGEKSLKLDLTKANFQDLLTEFGVSVDTSNMLSEVGAELGIDFENIDILELLKGLTLSETVEENLLTYNIALNNETEKALKLTLTYDKLTQLFGATFDRNISGYDVDLNISNLEINADNFALTLPSGMEEDITPIFDIVENAKIENGYALSSVVEIKVDEKAYNARINAQVLKNGETYLPYIAIDTVIESVKVRAYLVEDEIYLKIENLMLAIDLNDLDIEELKTILKDKFDLDTDAISEIAVTLPALAKFTISGLENGFEVGVGESIAVGDSITLSSTKFNLVTYNENGVMMVDNIQLSTSVTMAENSFALTLKLFDFMLGEEAENSFVFTEGVVTGVEIDEKVEKLENFVRLENLLEIFKKAVYAENLTFSVDAKVNENVKIGGEIKFDIKDMSFNFDAELDIDGLKLNLLLYGQDVANTKVIYATIGEKSLKLDLTKANFQDLLTEFGVSVDTSNMLSEVGAELGIDFENIDILELLKGLTLSETVEENLLTYNIALNNETEKALKLTLTYDKLTQLFGVAFDRNISGYDVSLNISNLEINADNFALILPSGTEEDITPIFDIVENAKVDDYTYAISGDLAVRYSTTSFYGDMLAMIVRTGDEYVPYVRIHTSAMNLSTYVYLLGEDIYLDLQGLRLTFSLSQDTIDEILTFVSDDLNMTISGMSALTSTFNVILPALKSISANWIDGGVQFNIGDALQYTDTAKFTDIVLQAFGVNSNNKIYPTKIVLGANINDANTDIYDSYEEYWLENEEAVTKNKNFAVYLTNVAIGKDSQFREDIVFGENGITVRGNVSVNEDVDASEEVKDMYSAESEFTSYSTLLPLVKAVYDYINSNNYRVGVVLDMGGTNISGDVTVELTNDANVSSSLFGGLGLKVQGDITIGDVIQDINNAHKISLIYDSNENANSGLYFTYAHGEFINSDTKFRGHIENASMSDMISMILGLANIELSDSMMESWDLEKSTTDFSFLHQLLGIIENDVSDEITAVDSTLGDVSNILKMLQNISFAENENGGYTLAIAFNFNESEGKLEIVFDEAGALANINFTLGDTLTAGITVQEFDETYFNYDTTLTHHNLSSLPEFMDIAVNTLNTKNVNFRGTLSVNLISFVTIDMSYDLYANFEDVSNPYIFAQVEIKTSSIASYVFNGSFDTRMVTFEYKDGALTFHRYSITNESEGILWNKVNWTKVVEDIVDKNTYQTSEIMPNITKLILDAFGIKETIKILGLIEINLPELIMDIINSIEVNPSLEETILGFTVDENIENMTLKLDGTSLLGSDSAEDLDVNLGAKKYQGYYKNENGELIEKEYSFIDSITGLNIELSGVSVTLNFNSVEGDSYQTNAYTLKSSYEDNSGNVVGGRTIYTNEHYRNQYMNSRAA